MGLGATLTTFTSGTVMSSSAVNTNFSNINGVSSITVNTNGNAATVSFATLANNIQTNGGILSFTTTTNNTLQCMVSGGLLWNNNNKFQSFTHFSGSGVGTYNHGYPNLTITPNSFYICPQGNGSDTWATENSSNSVVSLYANANWSFFGVAGQLIA